MFLIHWGYALANISAALIIYIYIGQTNPGVTKGMYVFTFYTFLHRNGGSQPLQASHLVQEKFKRINRFRYCEDDGVVSLYISSHFIMACGVFASTFDAHALYSPNVW